ncbi:prefoldin [Coprinellus micaceus]|uniref:Prefoldin subunit 4 n=1 Tax=Coprinellus micaceus TaxID=71717 RepID=A0A4Y7TQA2_COPMI|nr:prefoldin [Coprinellus micaceus]
MRMLEQEEEVDDGTEVTWEDQQRISTFSKLNARYGLILEKVERFEKKEALDDVAMELELADEEEAVLYKVGETFVHMRGSRAIKRLEKDQERVNEKLEELSSQSDDCQAKMKELKIQLYAKFGKSINLDE